MIYERIKKVISEFVIEDIDEIFKEDELIILGIDSIMMVELIIRLEDEFEVCFNDSDLNIDKLITVESILKLVTNSL